MAWRGKARQGAAWPGEARLGLARRGFTLRANRSQRGLLRLGKARQGEAGRGPAGLGEVPLRGRIGRVADWFLGKVFNNNGASVMGMQTREITIRGLSPLLMHNGQTADPLNKFSKQLKAVSGKRKKTDEDYAEMSKIEWHAGLYVDKDGELIIPSTLIEASIQDGAKKSKLGKAFKSAVFVNDDAKVDIGVKKKAIDLFGDENYRDVRGVRIGQARIMRTRPVFANWKCKFTLYFDDEQVNESDVSQALSDAGSKCGIGDFRPKFGRFEVI